MKAKNKKTESPDDMVFVGCHITRRQRDKVKAVARENYQPLSWFIRKALDEKLEARA